MITNEQALFYRKILQNKPKGATSFEHNKITTYFTLIDGEPHEWVTEMGERFWRRLNRAVIHISIEEIENLVMQHELTEEKQRRLPMPQFVINQVSKSNLANKALATKLGLSEKQVIEIREQLNNG